MGATGTVTCTNPSLAVGSAAFTLVANVIGSTPAGTVLSDTVTASSSSGVGIVATAVSTQAVPNFGNPGATATTTVAGARPAFGERNFGHNVRQLTGEHPDLERRYSG